MAKDKKSFVLYADLIHTVEQMPKSDAGELFLHILKYVNDQNPISDNLIVKLTFEPIKQQLKRDLKEWEQAKIEKSDAGILGNLKRWHNDLYLQVIDNQLSLSQASELVAQRQGAIKNVANVAVTVNDNVTVNVNDNVINNKNKELNISFEDFWNLYDKKVDRKSAEIKWKNLTDEEREKSMNHIPNYIKATQDKQYRKNPDTYLNNKSFNDEIIDRTANQNNLPNSVNISF